MRTWLDSSLVDLHSAEIWAVQYECQRTSASVYVKVLGSVTAACVCAIRGPDVVCDSRLEVSMSGRRGGPRSELYSPAQNSSMIAQRGHERRVAGISADILRVTGRISRLKRLGQNRRCRSSTITLRHCEGGQLGEAGKP